MSTSAAQASSTMLHRRTPAVYKAAQ